MMKGINRILLVLFLITLVFIPGKSVLANSPPPSVVLWFSFEKSDSPSIPQAVQLIGCSSPDCPQPILLQEFGDCSAPSCSSQKPVIDDWGTEADCIGLECRFSTLEYPTEYFQLVVEYGDRTLSSQSVKELPTYYGDEQRWNVIPQMDHLRLIKEGPRPLPIYAFTQSLTSFGVTLLVEIIIFAILLQILGGISLTPSNLLAVFLINLITYPGVWISVPNFSRFHRSGQILGGLIILSLAILSAYLLVRIYQSRDHIQRRKRIIFTIISIPLIIGFITIIVGLLSYGSRTIDAWGLSQSGVIITAELLAIFGEAILLYFIIFRDQKNSLLRAGYGSLVMNLSSMILGWLLFNQTYY
jgi:hypothetical protein